MRKEKGQREPIAAEGLARHILVAQRDEKLLDIALCNGMRRKPRLFEKDIDAAKVTRLSSRHQTRKLHVRHELVFNSVGHFGDLLFYGRQQCAQLRLDARPVRAFFRGGYTIN